jgi:methionine-rich copper-binding protein CopC
MFKRQLLAGIVSLGLMTVSPAFGHAKLKSSAPAADSELDVAPKVLILSFDENVRLAALKLSLGDKDIPITLDRAAAAAPTVTVTLPPLSAGKYLVKWSALSPDDGHVVKGSFSFAIRG